MGITSYTNSRIHNWLKTKQEKSWHHYHQISKHKVPVSLYCIHAKILAKQQHCGTDFHPKYQLGSVAESLAQLVAATAGAGLRIISTLS